MQFINENVFILTGVRTLWVFGRGRGY